MNFVINYRIQEKKPFEDLSFEERRVFKECYDSGYFEGVVPVEMINGRIVAEYRNDPRLTLKGLEFLDSLQQNPCNKPDKANCSERKDKPGKKFYQSGVFWAAVAVFVTITLWCVDRFYFGIAP